ncbi:hypothetical protein BDV98DRAFT_271977 [Pterulicium gracile]|uniref:Secreted protein n=1 Tax=Pterulicium gracile TaxID=1884261 RepID=A0A5C3Q5Q8_9AGAR|nr:hypothetical protein BDV98DRAFT_271977 [Pterula gracilis]
MSYTRCTYKRLAVMTGTFLACFVCQRAQTSASVNWASPNAIRQHRLARSFTSAVCDHGCDKGLSWLPGRVSHEERREILTCFVFSPVYSFTRAATRLAHASRHQTPEEARIRRGTSGAMFT